MKPGNSDLTRRALAAGLKGQAAQLILQIKEAEQAGRQRAREEQHRVEMKLLRKQELENQERQNRFQRDLLFLEKESPPDRKSYIINRSVEESAAAGGFLEEFFRPKIREAMLTCFNEFLPRHEQEIWAIQALGKQLSDCRQKGAELRERRAVIASQAKKAAANPPFFTLIFVLWLGALLGLFFCLGRYMEDHNSTLFIPAAVFAALVMTGLCLFARRSYKQSKCEQALHDIEAELRAVQNEFEPANMEKSKKETAVIRLIISESKTAISSRLRSDLLRPESFREPILSVVEEFQERIPKSLRINTAELTDEDLRTAFSSIMDAMVPRILDEESKCVQFGFKDSGSEC